MMTFDLPPRRWTTLVGRSSPAMGTAVVSVTAAASDGTGTWTQIVAASVITNDFCIYAMSLFSGLNAGHWVADIGFGAAAAEVQLGSVGGNDTSAVMGVYCPFPIPLWVPANSRIAVRISNSNGTGRAFGVRFYYYDGAV